MPPAFVLSQDQTLRLTQRSTSSHRQTPKPTKDPHQTRFVRPTTITRQEPQAIPRAKTKAKPPAKPRTRKRGRQALSNPQAAAHASLLDTNNVKKRDKPRPGRSRLDVPSDRVEEAAYTPALCGLSIQLMTFFRPRSKPRNIGVFRLSARSAERRRKGLRMPPPRAGH